MAGYRSGDLDSVDNDYSTPRDYSDTKDYSGYDDPDKPAYHHGPGAHESLGDYYDRQSKAKENLEKLESGNNGTPPPTTVKTTARKTSPNTKLRGGKTTPTD